MFLAHSSGDFYTLHGGGPPPPGMEQALFKVVPTNSTQGGRPPPPEMECAVNADSGEERGREGDARDKRQQQYLRICAAVY